jgi:hypothetical protein
MILYITTKLFSSIEKNQHHVRIHDADFFILNDSFPTENIVTDSKRTGITPLTPVLAKKM